MTKKVLAIYYSQTGQLGEIVKQFTHPFLTGDVQLEIVEVEPKDPFVFPWNGTRFFQAMPDSVREIPVPLKNFDLQEEKYDLIVFGYQPWFLSPSIPATSILSHPKIQQRLEDTPVITIIGARNMWINAQEKVKKRLAAAGGRLVGNVALIDRGNNLTSAVSIVHWMMKGKKDRPYGIFPKPGVSDEDIAGASRFGDIALAHLKSENWKDLQSELVKQKALEIRYNIMFIESKAGRLFSLWANFIANRKNKDFWIQAFKYYLFIALFLVSPLVLLINNLVVRPFTFTKMKKKRNYYLGLNT